MKKFFSLLLSLVLVFSITACGSNSTPNSPSAETDGTDNSNLKFAYIVKNQTNPFFIAMAEGFTAACQEYGIESTIQATEAESDIDEQVQMCQTMLTQGYDAIFVTPLSSSAIVPFVLECNQAGVPIILIDTGADAEALKQVDAHYDYFCTSDNFSGGVLAAQALKDALGNKGNIAILNGTPGATTTTAINEGFYTVLNDSNMVVVSEESAEWNRNIAYDVFSNVIAAHPDLNGVLAANDEMALGAIRAMEDAGIDYPPIYALNATNDGIEAVKAGKMSGSVNKKPYEQGYTAVERAISLLSGETLSATEEMLEPSMVDASNAG